MFRNVYAQLRKVNEELKKARKSIDSLKGDWWHKPIPWTPAEENTIDVSSSKQLSSKRRNSLDDITSRKQLLRRKMNYTIPSVKLQIVILFHRTGY